MWMNGSRSRRSTPANARRTGKPSPSKPDGAVVTERTRRRTVPGAGAGRAEGWWCPRRSRQACRPPWLRSQLVVTLALPPPMSSHLGDPVQTQCKETLAKNSLHSYGVAHARIRRRSNRPSRSPTSARCAPCRTRCACRLLGQLRAERAGHGEPARPRRRREQRLDQLPPAAARGLRLRRGGRGRGHGRERWWRARHRMTSWQAADSWSPRRAARRSQDEMTRQQIDQHAPRARGLARRRRTRLGRTGRRRPRSTTTCCGCAPSRRARWPTSSTPSSAAGCASTPSDDPDRGHRARRVLTDVVPLKEWPL